MRKLSSCEHGHEGARYNLDNDVPFVDAVDAFVREDYETAYKLFLPLAEQGHDDAQYLLASMHLGHAEGVPQDY